MLVCAQTLIQMRAFSSHRCAKLHTADILQSISKKFETHSQPNSKYFRSINFILIKEIAVKIIWFDFSAIFWCLFVRYFQCHLFSFPALHSATKLKLKASFSNCWHTFEFSHHQFQVNFDKFILLIIIEFIEKLLKFLKFSKTMWKKLILNDKFLFCFVHTNPHI